MLYCLESVDASASTLLEHFYKMDIGKPPAFDFFIQKGVTSCAFYLFDVLAPQIICAVVSKAPNIFNVWIRVF